MKGNNERFYMGTDERTTPMIAAALHKSSSEAAKMPRTGKRGDSSVTIQCGGFEEHWNSRYLCFHFYFSCANCTEGSASERYWAICSGLLEGEDVPSDGMPLRRKTA